MSVVYVNLYKQGFYHRAGKPSTLSIHPGDMYPSREAAVADINLDAPYVGTVPVMLGNIPFFVYGENSAPTPLRESRPWFAQSITQEMLEWDPSTPGNLPITHSVGETFTAEPSQVVGLRPLTAFEEREAAVEVGDDYSGPSYEQWKAANAAYCPMRDDT